MTCFYCAHDCATDLGWTYSWLHGGWVRACRDLLWCEFREFAIARSRDAHPSSGGAA